MKEFKAKHNNPFSLGIETVAFVFHPESDFKILKRKLMNPKPKRIIAVLNTLHG